MVRIDVELNRGVLGDFVPTQLVRARWIQEVPKRARVLVCLEGHLGKLGA